MIDDLLASLNPTPQQQNFVQQRKDLQNDVLAVQMQPNRRISSNFQGNTRMGAELAFNTPDSELRYQNAVAQQMKANLKAEQQQKTQFGSLFQRQGGDRFDFDAAPALPEAEEPGLLKTSYIVDGDNEYACAMQNDSPEAALQRFDTEIGDYFAICEHQRAGPSSGEPGRSDRSGSRREKIVPSQAQSRAEEQKCEHLPYNNQNSTARQVQPSPPRLSPAAQFIDYFALAKERAARNSPPQRAQVAQQALQVSAPPLTPQMPTSAGMADYYAKQMDLEAPRPCAQPNFFDLRILQAKPGTPGTLNSAGRVKSPQIRQPASMLASAERKSAQPAARQNDASSATVAEGRTGSQLSSANEKAISELAGENAALKRDIGELIAGFKALQGEIDAAERRKSEIQKARDAICARYSQYQREVTGMLARAARGIE